MPPLAVEHSNRELRGRLSQITQRPLETQELLIRDLQPPYRHSISLDEPAKKPSYNCVEYAFDLINLPDDIRHAVDGLESWRRQRQLPRIGPSDTTFVNFLIERGALNEPIHAESGDIIVYLDKKRVRHAGKMQGEMVCSKWNYDGHRWRHRPYEVPIGYGADVRRFKSMTTNEVLQLMSKFMDEIRHADGHHNIKRLLESLYHWPIL